MLITLAGCGGEEAAQPGPPGGGAGPEIAVVHGAPRAMGEEPASEEHAVEGYAAAMASNGALVAVGTTKAVYELGASGPLQLAIVGDGPDLPVSTGQVRAMAPYEEGLLVAAEGGLFYTAGGALQPSLGSEALAALTITAMNARVVRVTTGEDDATETHLALVTTDGARELSRGEMVSWTVEGEAGAPTAMLAQQDRIILAFEERVYEIDKATSKAYPVLFDAGRIRAIACDSLACEEGSLIYLASDEGLVERSPDGAYTLYPLAAEGEPAVAVESFALDAQKQRLYALAGPSVLRVHAGALPDAIATATPADLPRRIAVDKLGDVWSGGGLAVRKHAVGAPLSFAADVRPIMHEYCAGCHADGSQGAPRVDFTSYDVMLEAADVLLVRVTQGTMPPAGYEKKLPKEKIQILIDWDVTRAP
ncbi:hypothetical protein [Chondromyces apiculatus]|nr:hypothetical protein [Chondromyces apiculatus]